MAHNELEKSISGEHKDIHNADVRQRFKRLIQIEQYVGELYSINYESVKVQIHDKQRADVGGIPSLSFLVATRINPDSENIDFKAEDSSIILLRVMDATQMPNSTEAERIRLETAQRVSGEPDKHWDSKGSMDEKTKVYLGYAAVECRIIGTFFFDENPKNIEGPLVLKFGSDISNYYPNRGLKVYKPNGDALKEIINYIDSSNLIDHKEKFNNTSMVKLGQIRYASTNRKYQKVDDVPVFIYPADLLSQKTALFGMTRTGKSNTTKIIIKSVYELRFPANNEDTPLRIGQIVFDPNGEYANENIQDKDGKNNPNAIKNIWEINCTIKDQSERQKYKEKEVVTYGITSHPNDPDRKLMLLNFYTNENLQIGKEIIDNLFTDDDPNYLKNFTHVAFEKPDESDRSAITRFNRRVLAYRAILSRAGFTPPSNIKAFTKGLFNDRLIAAMRNYTGEENQAIYQSAATIFSNENPTWGQISDAFESLDKFIRERNSGYNDFESWYVNERPNASGDRWADEDFKKLIGIFQYPNGIRRIGKAVNQHTNQTNTDYANDIYEELKKGKLVIIDQSSGEPELNRSSAKRIMTKIFKENQRLFINGSKIIPEILIYLEEAHNLLPSGSETDLQDIWVRTAKEGAKYRIGMVYATQEVSSIQKNILKNTSNWFIGHLNNTDETKELSKYYDFKDFEPSIRRAQDKGFLRIKTLSNMFVIPIQVDKFEVKENNNAI